MLNDNEIVWLEASFDKIDIAFHPYACTIIFLKTPPEPFYLWRWTSYVPEM
jgi:hypothetical protein